LVATGSGEGGSVGKSSGVAVGCSAAGGGGSGVSGGVGGIESCCSIAVVGVNVGKGVRVGGRFTSSWGMGNRDNNEQPKVSKIKKALGMLQALDRDRDDKVASSWIRNLIELASLS